MQRQTTQNELTLFSGKAKAYINSRPGYPIEIINFIAQECVLSPQSVIVDIG